MPDLSDLGGGTPSLHDLIGEVVLATLPATRCITDGEHRCGCSVYDGAKTRERLRFTVTALNRAYGPASESAPARTSS